MSEIELAFVCQRVSFGDLDLAGGDCFLRLVNLNFVKSKSLEETVNI